MYNVEVNHQNKSDLFQRFFFPSPPSFIHIPADIQCLHAVPIEWLFKVKPLHGLPWIWNLFSLQRRRGKQGQETRAQAHQN
jgi:hypothetical protein